MRKNEDMVDLSVVIPIYNEQEVIPILRKAISKFFAEFSVNYELILIDDASTDETKKMLQDWHSEDSRMRVIYLSSNIGHQGAILEGMRSASARYIVTMDADLQDPLEEIPKMIKKADEGFEIVHMQRVSRESETLFRRFSAWSFYRIAKLFNSATLLDVGDFRLMTKEVVDKFFTGVFHPILLRKAVVQIPVKQTVLQYDRKKRVAGRSKFSLKKLTQLALSSGKLKMQK